MAKWKCVASWDGPEIPVGKVIEATKVDERLLIQETVRRASGRIVFPKGKTIPIIGGVWEWEEVK